VLAGILVEPNRIEIQERENPRPSEGEVLIKVRAALTCGTDLKAFLRGHPMIPMPGIFGHEFSGTVIETGKGVREVKPGDEIMAVHSAPCRQCSYCKKKLYNLCERIMGTKTLGAFAEYMVVPSPLVRQNIFPKPPDLAFEHAAFLEPLACVVHGLAGLNITRNDNVLIIGAGPIGLLHLLLVRLKGARVMITGLEEERLNLARKLGADMVSSPAELIQAVKEFTHGQGVDFVFECTGRRDVWERSVDYVRRGGTVILFGGCKAGTRVTYDAYRLHYDEITLKGVFHFTPHDVKTAYGLLRDSLDVSPLISGRYPLKDLHKAFDRLSKGDGIKYAITP
jgi:L-iditol 2-dehydrogenase